MDRQDAERLSEATYKILKNPDAITSEDFMAVYNVVYKFCTQPTAKYEVKGAPVYNLLVDVVRTHTCGLEGFTSIESFNAGFAAFERSASHLANAYEYLERYYIKTCIMRRDTYVRHVKSLLYLHYCTNYVEKLRPVFEKLVIMEAARMRGERLSAHPLRAAIDAYKTLQLSCDGDDKYAALKDAYLAEFTQTVDYGDPMNRLLQATYRELSMAADIFDMSSYQALAKRIVFNLAPRSGEIAEYILRKIGRRRSFFHAYRILEILGPAHADPFVRDLGLFIDKRLESGLDFDSLVELFLELSVHAEHGFNRNKSIKRIIKSKFLVVARNLMVLQSRDEAERSAVLFVARIDGITEDADRSHTRAVLAFLGLMEKKDAIVEKITFNLQKRLLSDARELGTERFLVESLMDVLPHDDAFKLRFSLSDMLFSRQFHTTRDELCAPGAVSAPEDDFAVEPKLLTSGFWHIKSESLRLFDSLETCRRHLVDALRRRSKKALVTFNHRMSAAVLELNTFRVTLPTDTASLLLILADRDGASFGELEQATQDPRLRDNLRILVESRLVCSADGLFSVNGSYDGGDLGLFGIDYVEATKSACPSLVDVRLDRTMVMEAALMRHMKRAVACERSTLVHRMTDMLFHADETLDALDGLVENGYLVIEEGVIRYVP